MKKQSVKKPNINFAECGIPVGAILEYCEDASIKATVVDDRKVILGSANINDRSMLGTRDSEFAIVIQEERKLDSKMGGKPYKASNFAASFRRALMAEHMGLPAEYPLLEDPLNSQLHRELNGRAKNNTILNQKILEIFKKNMKFCHFFAFLLIFHFFTAYYLTITAVLKTSILLVNLIK